ncbi:MAG: hypothetical protein M1832_000193 [Thelocarpon impressellum]|nr:MAG: hypothetical protein M1832_000193 [Thelocarpon impressellum]
MVEWLRGVISHDWDGKWEMSRFSAIGSAITILGILHQNIDCLDLSPEAFYMYFISRVIDPMSVPLEWQPLQGGSKTVHLLGCPFLFPPETLVTFSRAINFKKMSASFQDAIVTHKLIVKMSPLDPANNFEDRFMGRLRIAACPYLVLKGLAQLIDWKDGDVGDVFMRTYEFSIDDLGTRVDIDMEKVDEDDRVAALKDVKGKRRANGVQLAVEMASLSADQDPARQKSKLVTNCNRRQYVQDYVSWLTDKSIRPQYEAFSRGFFACFEKNELSIFTPEGLQRMIEGVKEIDVEMLKRTARYEDGFSADHRLIKSFWEIIREYPSEQKKALLEFVTASDRAPVNGIGSILFVIQKNGPDSEAKKRLPTSLTCFGRLLLPEYSTKDKLREKLRLALENGKGFGVP